MDEPENHTVKNGKCCRDKTDQTETIPQDYPRISYFGLFRYATVLDKIYILLGTVCSISCGALLPLLMYLAGNITGDIVKYATVISNTSLTKTELQEAKDELLLQAKYFAINLTLVSCAELVLTYVGNTLFILSAIKQVQRIRRLYFSSMLKQDVSWYDTHKVGDFTTVLSDLSKVEEAIGEKVAIFLFFKAIFVSGVIQALVLGWELTLIGLISLPLSLISMGAVTWVSVRFARKEVAASSDASATAEEALSSVQTVIAFGGQAQENERYQQHLRTAKRANIMRSIWSAISNGLLWFFVFACYALSFWYGIGLIIRDRNLAEDYRYYTPGNVVAVFGITVQSCWFFGQGAPYIAIFSAAQEAASRAFFVIASVPTINTSKSKCKRPVDLKGNLKFKNVCFCYPSRKEVKVLDGISFDIKAGETVAIVGSSGGGKSTIIQLLQRFYDPGFGEISLDGYNIKDIDLGWLRRQIGVVSQEPVLFATSISENIKFGNPNATQADVEKAARKANAHDFIRMLPRGYDTIVGDRGSQLSGGQKQRIAIARALIREPTILLLDEATSALDTSSEAKVQAALDMASVDYTTIIVAHRLSTIRKANRIIVISNGSVVEQGSHEELFSMKGEYYELITSQQQTTEKHKDVSHEKMTVTKGLSNCNFNADRESHYGSNCSDVFSLNEAKRPSFWNILKYNRPEWYLIVIGCIASIIVGASMPMYSVAYGDIIGVMSITSDDDMRKEGNTLCLYFLIIGIVTSIATFIQLHAFTISGEKLTMRLRSSMFASMMKQEVGWFDRKENSVGALCTRLSNQVASVQGASGQCIGTVLSSLSTFIISSVIALYLDWRLALVTLAFAPAIFAGVFFESKIVQVGGLNQKGLEDAGGVAVEAIGNIRTVISLGCEDVFYQKYTKGLISHYAVIKKKLHFRSFILGVARSTMCFCYIGSMYYGVQLIVHANLEYSIMFKVGEAVVFAAWSIGNAMAYSPNVQNALNAASDVIDLLERQPAITSSKVASKVPWNKGHVEYSRVYFSYPTRRSTGVLNGLDVTVPDGHTIALVGPSGCGKSTMLSLLERFYDPMFGDISVDNELIQHTDLEVLRSQIGIVFQEPTLFDRTVAENISYGANYRNVSMQEIISAAQKANIHDFISSLPQGYSTRLGSKGAQLSGGQKQRIAIARALIRNPKILLLDEATSALDSESEKIVQAALNNARKGRTCIMVAHRLTTVQDADTIFVINEGKVAECGKHTELLQKRGLYYKLYTTQASS